MAKKRSKREPDHPPSYEESLEQLKAILHQLEEGEIGLNESLEQYEKGVALLRVPRKKPKKAILKKPKRKPRKPLLKRQRKKKAKRKQKRPKKLLLRKSLQWTRLHRQKSSLSSLS